MELLKQEYAKLQGRYNELERKYNNVVATNGIGDDDTFASRLVNTISFLYDSESFSDIKIKLSDRQLHAHRLVLSARSDLWSEQAISDKHELDWSSMDSEVAQIIVMWMYNDSITPKSDEIILKVCVFHIHCIIDSIFIKVQQLF